MLYRQGFRESQVSPLHISHSWGKPKKKGVLSGTFWEQRTGDQGVSYGFCSMLQARLRPKLMRLALYGYRWGAIKMVRSPEIRPSRSDATHGGRPPHRYSKCDKRCLCLHLGRDGPGEASFPLPSSDEPTPGNKHGLSVFRSARSSWNVNAWPPVPPGRNSFRDTIDRNS